MSINRGGRELARPTADHGIIGREQVVADDFGEFRAELFGDAAGGGGKLRRAQIGRRGVDQIARQIHRFRRRRHPRPVAGGGPAQFRRRPVALFVALEDIARQRPAQRRRIRGGRREITAQPVLSGGQGLSRGGVIPDRGLVGNTEDGGLNRAVCARQHRNLARLAFEARTLQPGLFDRAARRQPGLEIIGDHNVQGNIRVRGLN